MVWDFFWRVSDFGALDRSHGAAGARVTTLNRSPRLLATLRTAVTFALVCFAWIFFPPRILWTMRGTR